MRNWRKVGSLVLALGSLAGSAWAEIEPCNVNPKGGQEIIAALQCLDRNIKALSQQGAPASAGKLSGAVSSTRYVAGTYQSPNGKRKFRVSGPARLSEQGREKWAITADDGTFSASWITGPLEGHPVPKGVDNDIAKDLSPAYDYGRVGEADQNAFLYWRSGQLIGVSQVGEEDITIARFATDGNARSVVEQASFTVRLVKTPASSGR